jgi:predicted GH43/DUF377 family glycosyl hydrolase
MTRGLLGAALLLAGCGRYGDFTLPVAAGHPPALLWQPSAAAVLEPGPAGAWDAVDALNPSVVAHAGELWNFYSGYDGKTWHTGLAVSADGIVWRKRGRVLSPDPATWEGSYIAANGSALRRGGEFWYWYQAGTPPAIGLARSADGVTWRKEPAPVVPLGPRGSFDERAAADPSVLDLGGRLYLYYLGEDRARRQRIGLAVSDDGLRWTKLRANPILELGPAGAFDENGLGEPAVWRTAGGYFMLYTGRARNETRRMGLAFSVDGVHWQRRPPALSGAETWNLQVVCDATVLAEDGRVRVWYGGGDVAHSAENIHGRIGYGELRAEAPRR